MFTKRHYIILVAIASVLMLLAVGCSANATGTLAPLATPGVAKTAFPTGTFTSGDCSMEYKPDGAYSLNCSRFSEKGTHTETGDQLAIMGDGCGTKGIYVWVYDGKALSAKVLDDNCVDRRGKIDGGVWNKKQ